MCLAASIAQRSEQRRRSLRHDSGANAVMILMENEKSKFSCPFCLDGPPVWDSYGQKRSVEGLSEVVVLYTALLSARDGLGEEVTGGAHAVVLMCLAQGQTRFRTSTTCVPGSIILLRDEGTLARWVHGHRGLAAVRAAEIRCRTRREGGTQGKAKASRFCCSLTYATLRIVLVEKRAEYLGPACPAAHTRSDERFAIARRSSAKIVAREPMPNISSCSRCGRCWAPRPHARTRCKTRLKLCSAAQEHAYPIQVGQPHGASARVQDDAVPVPDSWPLPGAAEARGCSCVCRVVVDESSSDTEL